MKTLITGASGLLGGNLVRHLWSKEERDLRVLLRKSSQALAITDLQVEVTYGDLRDSESLTQAMRGVDRVYHCAALVSQWRPSYQNCYQINVQGTINILEAALKAGVKRAVYVSTVDTLGLSSLEKPADENWPEHESMAIYGSPYTDTKFQAEQEAKKFLEQGLDLVIIKPTFMIGEWDLKPTSGQMIVQICKGRAAGYPGGGNNFVDVLDVCEGMRLAMEKGKKGEAYILANDSGNLTYREFFNRAAQIAGVKPPGFKIPYPAAVFGGYLFDLLGRIFRFEPDINSVTAKMGYADHYFTARKAITELGLPQSPIENAVKRAIAWFTKYRYL